MKEIQDPEKSVLVIIVKGGYGDEEVAVEAFRSGSRGLPRKPGRESVPSGPDMPALPEKFPRTVTLGQYQKIQQAVRFIDDNYRTDIRLNAVAARAQMSPSHFSRVFKKVTGRTYQDYLNDRRVTKAKDLLNTSSQSIAEIAASLGFADATGFGRIFKKLAGQTPSAYRSLPQKQFFVKKA